MFRTKEHIPISRSDFDMFPGLDPCQEPSNIHLDQGPSYGNMLGSDECVPRCFMMKCAIFAHGNLSYNVGPVTQLHSHL